MRAAVALITGRKLHRDDFDEDQLWDMLDDVQKRVVVHYRPLSKFAQWFDEEQERQVERYAQASPAARKLFQRIQEAKIVTQVIELELKQPLAEALALFCKRAFIERVKPFAEEKEGDSEAWMMLHALEELRLALKVAGFSPR
ncbi:hypothetical protein K9B32_00040 [Rhizobium sp. 3T7]|uniref:DUF7706 family protein n=1 Tax=Rhizobium sp. 3T7 TaxID=2874922 RepID=UPI001CC9C45B|nr:hypothetical protein [Rhizobium sp. 3T7]MBZ9788533.1 hypothetical protein [Rhizobium sp. 3T7]